MMRFLYLNVLTSYSVVWIVNYFSLERKLLIYSYKYSFFFEIIIHWSIQILIIIFLTKNATIGLNTFNVILSRQHFIIAGKYRRVFVIYRRISNSKTIIGYSINHELIWLSELEIKRTIFNPNYLLRTTLAVHWEW